MIVWHYTTEEKLNPIYADGCLKPSAIGIGPKERPVLWFSSNPIWEPTANKALGIAGVGLARPMTNGEMAAHFRLIRFGLDHTLTLPWNLIRKAANIAHTEQRRLIKRAKKVNAFPSQWFGILGLPLLV